MAQSYKKCNVKTTISPKNCNFDLAILVKNCNFDIAIFTKNCNFDLAIFTKNCNFDLAVLANSRDSVLQQEHQRVSVQIGKYIPDCLLHYKITLIISDLVCVIL